MVGLYRVHVSPYYVLCYFSVYVCLCSYHLFVFIYVYYVICSRNQSLLSLAMQLFLYFGAYILP